MVNTVNSIVVLIKSMHQFFRNNKCRNYSKQKNRDMFIICFQADAKLTIIIQEDFLLLSLNKLVHVNHRVKTKYY